jgi:dihydroorotate dehydrogenase (NAD+) catalytic subunit
MSRRARSLAVDVGGLVLPTPVMIASGCGGTGRELTGLVDLRKVGGIVSRTITVGERLGAPMPRISESSAGIVWDTGLQNPGLEAFVAGELTRLGRGGVRVIVSIGGGSLEEYVRLSSALQGRPEVAAIEIYLAGPDDELERSVLGAHPDRVNEIVGAVARMSLVPVFAKIPGGCDDVVELARAAVRAGATGVTLLGPPLALGVEAATGPIGRVVHGWLSGPALKPITLRAVSDVASELPGVAVIASGGVRTGEDAVDCLLAGAWAVQVGTATLADPTSAVTIAQGILWYLDRRGHASPDGLRPSTLPDAGAEATRTAAP